MVTYTHFGKQPDVFKHLLLCEVLQIEKPQIYVESNSACVIYTMAHTPEQEYGIYHFAKENEQCFLCGCNPLKCVLNFLGCNCSGML